MAERLERKQELGKEGLPKDGVHKEAGSPERGTFMPSKDERIRELFATLNASEKVAFIKAFEIALTEQSLPASSPRSLEQAIH